jgi:nitrous oxidase accessory protein
VAVDICSNVFWWSKVASISLSDISLASIMHNKASDGYGDSIKLTSASHMTIDDNSINTAGCGILILNSYNVTASNNSIGTMSYVDAVPAVSIGVYIESSRMVNLKDNSVTGTAVGIEIIPISDYVTTLSNITVYRNRIHSNAVNAIDMGGSENLWDDGIATGNYWDDYDGVDENADGIGDTPYVIDEDSVDHYPLMN